MSKHVDPEKMDIKQCTVLAQLYHQSIPQLTALVKREEKIHSKGKKERGLKQAEFNVTTAIKEEVAGYYDGVVKLYDLLPGESSHAAVVAMLREKNGEKLRCVLMLHRFVMTLFMKSHEPANALIIESGQIEKELLRLIDEGNPMAPTNLDLWRTGSAYIGRPHTTGLAYSSGNEDGTIYVLNVSQSGDVGQRLIAFNTRSVMKGLNFAGIKEALQGQEKAVARANKAEKRVGGIAGFIAAVAAVKLSIGDLIESMGDTDVDDFRNQVTNQKVYSKCQALLFIVSCMTSPARGVETLSRAQSDATERVEGCEVFMLTNRILMDPSALPRTQYYELLQYHAKFERKMSSNMQQTPPLSASAICYSDTLLYTLTIMARINPALLSSRANPNMRIFMHLGAKPGEVEVLERADRELKDQENSVSDDDEAEDATPDEELNAAQAARDCELCPDFREMIMGTMNLKLRSALPPAAVSDYWLTGYSGRTGIAALCEALSIHDDPYMCAFVRKWYGHSVLSWQYRNYAKALGRMKVCLDCRDKESSDVGCACTGKRTRCKRAPSKRARKAAGDGSEEEGEEESE